MSAYIVFFTYNAIYVILCLKKNVYKTNIDPLIKLQNRAVRIINKAWCSESTNPLFTGSCMIMFLDVFKKIGITFSS